jgi:signal transduction histidine kinase
MVSVSKAISGDQAMNRVLVYIVETRTEQITLNFVNEVRKLKHYKLLKFEEVYNRGKAFLDAFLNSIKEDDLSYFVTYMSWISGERSKQGYDLDETLTAFKVLEENVWKSVMENAPSQDVPKLLKIANHVLGVGKDQLARVYLKLRIQTENKLKRAYKKLKNTQAQLVHSEKMASLGQVAAGVAHELNNPINFIYSNLDHLRDYISRIKRVIEIYSGATSGDKNLADLAVKTKEEVELDFILEDLDKLIKAFYDGAERTKNLVWNLRSFSRGDEKEPQEVDIHECIENTLSLLAHIYKHRITLHRNYGDIPKICGYASHLNQVFMNLLANAGQAIQGHGDVWIKTQLQGDKVIISIRDNGRGIPKKIIPKIFDPFFTTKTRGEGIGLGLSISYSLIEKHKGRIFVESQEGVGTTFTIELPTNAMVRKG